MWPKSPVNRLPEGQWVKKKYQSPREYYLVTETRELESHTDTRVIDLAKVSSKNTPRRLVSQKRNRAQEIVS